MKNHFVTIYSIFVSIIFTLALVFWGYNLYNEYSNSEERTSNFYQEIITNLKNDLSINDYTYGFEDLDFDKILINKENVYQFEIYLNNQKVVDYFPKDSYEYLSQYFVKNNSSNIHIKGKYYFVKAKLYLLRPYSIYYYSKIAFLVILIFTIITALLIFFYNTQDNNIKENEKINKNNKTTVEKVSNTSSKIFESVDLVHKKPLELNRPAIFQQNPLNLKPVLPSEELKPMKIEALEKNTKAQGLFSPITGLGWEEYLLVRLNNEIKRAISSEIDLSVFELQIPGLERTDPLIRKICDYLTVQFQFKDLLFEYKNDRYIAIKIAVDIEEAFSYAKRMLEDINKILKEKDIPCFIGITSRSIRMITGEGLLKEADESIIHAKNEKDSPIVAFKVDVEKYRAYVGKK